MKSFAVFLLCIMATNNQIKAAEEKLAGLDSLRWNYRVLLVFAREPSASNASSNLHELAAEIEERDIIWFLLGNDALQTNYDGPLDDKLREIMLESYFTPKPSATAVLLIGKDGQVKSRSSDLDLEATFGLIDQMPMRRQEIRRQTGPTGSSRH